MIWNDLKRTDVASEAKKPYQPSQLRYVFGTHVKPVFLGANITAMYTSALLVVANQPFSKVPQN